jgi:hypothetical protein
LFYELAGSHNKDSLDALLFRGNSISNPHGGSYFILAPKRKTRVFEKGLCSIKRNIGQVADCSSRRPVATEQDGGLRRSRSFSL